MTTAEFVAWMNTQFKNHGAAKVVPAEELAVQSVSDSIAATLLSDATEEVSEQCAEELEGLQKKLKKLEAEIGKKALKLAEERFKKVKPPDGPEIVGKIEAWLKKHNRSHWRNSISAVASKFIPAGFTTTGKTATSKN
jgi:hypothetical protein